jgi:hypothetical protein
MPAARQVVTRAPHRRVGFVACPWFQTQSIEYESLLERDFIRLALLNRNVCAIAHQPFLLDLGNLGRYTPDFLLVGPSLKTVVEVKPSAFSSNAKNTPRLARAGEILREKGYRFLVATEKFIHAEERHERAAILLRHARSHLPTEASERVLVAASRFPKGIAIRALASNAAVSISTVLTLIGRRHLRTDQSLSFGEQEIVYPTGERHDDL